MLEWLRGYRGAGDGTRTRKMPRQRWKIGNPLRLPISPHQPISCLDPFGSPEGVLSLSQAEISTPLSEVQEGVTHGLSYGARVTPSAAHLACG